MKKKQKQQLKDKSIVELTKMIDKERTEMNDTLLKQPEQKDKNKFKHRKHNIARMLTILHDKQRLELMEKSNTNVQIMPKESVRKQKKES